jgi:uncharacterized protein (DUF934 family)
MPYIKAGRRADDPFVRVPDDAPVPATGSVLVSAARFFAAIPEFSQRHAPIGVIWPNNRKPAELAPHLDGLALVALVFPSFRDGRAYSQARLLRERYGFRGELRATGDVLRDQFLFLARSGFDAFEIKKEADADAFAAVLNRFSVVYQPGADDQIALLRRRLHDDTRHDPAARREAVS